MASGDRGAPWDRGDGEAVDRGRQSVARRRPRVDPVVGESHALQRLTSAALAFEEVEHEVDVRSVLATVQSPTLVLSRSEPAQAKSADLAARIPGAKHVRLPGKDWIPYAGNIDALIDEVERFVRSVSAEEASFDRVLATVLFTDIVGSTQKA